MPIPLTIPVMYEPGYHTSTIGRYADGQFIASVTAGYREGALPADDDDGWQRAKRWYAYLHRFDHDGRHLGSEARFAGTTADGEEQVLDRAERMLAELLDGLPDRRYGDVAVRLFRVEIDGILFGLVDETEEYGDDHVELYPDELGFNPPWEGEYDT
ncbi:MAG TPA: hypothetical protein VGD43_19630 [Micromonospora sp.]